MFFLPIFAIWWWLNHGRDLRMAGKAILSVIMGMLVISPATIHNYAVSGEFFPIQSVLGINFRQGNLPGATGVITMIPGTATDREHLFESAAEEFEHAMGREGGWKEIDRYYRDQALAYWKQDIPRTVGLFLRKIYWFIR